MGVACFVVFERFVKSGLRLGSLLDRRLLTAFGVFLVAYTCFGTALDFEHYRDRINYWLVRAGEMAALKAQYGPVDVLGQTLREMRDTARTNRKTAAAAHPVVKAVLEQFPGAEIVDLLARQGGETEAFSGERIQTTSTHGTGCTLASAVAASVAEGWTLADAVARAHEYVQAAIRSAPGYGAGHGPLDHAHVLRCR